jgi:hypothetical protein
MKRRMSVPEGTRWLEPALCDLVIRISWPEVTRGPLLELKHILLLKR